MAQIVTGSFFFDPEDLIYQFHFPGHPVVPGSVVIHAFMKAAVKNNWSEYTKNTENFRFRKFVTPGAYQYVLERKEQKLHCRLIKGEKAIVTGCFSL